MNSTRFINVPHITNFKELVQGEELIMRLIPRAKRKKEKSAGWRDEQRLLDKNASKKRKMDEKDAKRQQ